MTAPGAGDTLSFTADIRPLFRAKDRDSMQFALTCSTTATLPAMPTPSSALCGAGRCPATAGGLPLR
jgi:hypothetical protein